MQLTRLPNRTSYYITMPPQHPLQQAFDRVFYGDLRTRDIEAGSVPVAGLRAEDVGHDKRQREPDDRKVVDGVAEHVAKKVKLVDLTRGGEKEKADLGVTKDGIELIDLTGHR